MAEGSARVESIDALRALKVALIKFAEAANVALADAESDMQRTQVWLETEGPTYWNGQIAKRNEIVGRCKEAVRQKKLFKDSSGRTPSAIEEEKALRLAMLRLEEANQKLANVRKYSRVVQKETEAYKGHSARLASSVQSDIPLAVHQLSGMIATLEQYVALAPGADEASTAVTSESTTEVQSEVKEEPS